MKLSNIDTTDLVVELVKRATGEKEISSIHIPNSQSFFQKTNDKLERTTDLVAHLEDSFGRSYRLEILVD